MEYKKFERLLAQCRFPYPRELAQEYHWEPREEIVVILQSYLRFEKLIAKLNDAERIALEYYTALKVGDSFTADSIEMEVSTIRNPCTFCGSSGPMCKDRDMCSLCHSAHVAIRSNAKSDKAKARAAAYLQGIRPDWKFAMKLQLSDEELLETELPSLINKNDTYLSGLAARKRGLHEK